MNTATITTSPSSSTSAAHAPTPPQRPECIDRLGDPSKLNAGARLVLEYLLPPDRRLSPNEAYNRLGVGSLTSRVSEIKRWLWAHRSPWVIRGSWQRDPKRADRKFKAYVLVYDPGVARLFAADDTSVAPSARALSHTQAQIARRAR